EERDPVSVSRRRLAREVDRLRIIRNGRLRRLAELRDAGVLDDHPTQRPDLDAVTAERSELPSDVAIAAAGLGRALAPAEGGVLDARMRGRELVVDPLHEKGAELRVRR